MVPLALTAARNVPPLMLLAVPAIGTLLDLSFRFKRSHAIRKERPALNAAMLAAAIVIALGGVVSAWTLEVDRLGWHPLPTQALEAVSSCPGRLYNRYDEGGYLVWFARNQLVFLDGRQDPYPQELVLDQLHLEASGEYEATFERYKIRCAFIPSDSLLAHHLVSAGWHTMYDDQTWAVFAASSLP
jgi:hypothetical protein